MRKISELHFCDRLLNETFSMCIKLKKELFLEMNVSILSLIHSNIYSFLLFTGSNNYQVNKCHFSRSFAYSFFNSKSIYLANSAFVHMLNTIVYSDRDDYCVLTEDKITNCYISDLTSSIVNKVGSQNFNIEFTCIFNSTIVSNLVSLMFDSDLTLKFFECCFYNVHSNSPLINTNGRFQFEHSSLFNSTRDSYILHFNTESKTEQSSLFPDIQNINISYNTIQSETSLSLFFFGLKKTNEEIRIQHNLICNNHGGYNLITFDRFGKSLFKSDIFANNSCQSVLFIYDEKWGYETNLIEESTFLRNLKTDQSDFVTIFEFPNETITVQNCILDQALPTKQTDWIYLGNQENVQYDNVEQMILFGEFPQLNFIINTPPPSEYYECVIPAIIPWPTQSAPPTQTPLATSTASQSPPSTLTQSPYATPSQSPVASTIPYATPSQSLVPSTPIVVPSASSTEQTPMVSMTPTMSFEPSSNNKKEVKIVLIVGSLIIIAILAIIIVILRICICRKSNLICCKKKDNLNSLSPSVNLIQSNPSLIENGVQGLSSNESDLFNNNLHNTKFNYSLII